MKHKHAEILLAIAGGEDVDFVTKGNDSDAWQDLSIFPWMNPISNPENTFRVRPRVIRTEFGDIPKPFAPEEGDRYWTLTAGGTSTCYVYADDSVDRGKVDLGFSWKTAEEANLARSVISKLMWS